MKHSKKYRPRVWVLIALDVLCAGVVLVVFALFHHVLPQAGEEPWTIPVTEEPTVSSSPTSPTSPTGTTVTGSGVTETTAATRGTAMTTDTVPTAPSGGGWAEKWPDKFTPTVVKTENGYSSPQVSVTVEKVAENGVTYFFADIYVDTIENFRTAFANDKFGSGYRESVVSQGERHGAILAVNGDYYGNSAARKGTVIRNGIVYRSTKEAFDVCVLYRDGQMKTFSSAAFDAKTEAGKGAWQAWSFGPSLLHGDGSPLSNEEIVSEVKPNNPRTAVGYFEPGHYCFVVVDGRQDGYSKGMRLETMGAMMSARGCKAAYNLDGGATSVMSLFGKVVNQPYQNGRSCSDILYIGEVE